MKYLILLLLSTSVYAQGVKDGDVSYNGDLNNHNNLVSEGGSSFSEATGGEAVANGGEATANGNGGNVTIRNPNRIRLKNNATIALGAPNITAPCWVGFGGSASGSPGAIGLIIPKRDHKCLAVYNFQILLALGLPEPAAKAYCTKKAGLYKNFGTIADCKTAIYNSIMAREPEPEPEITYETVSEPVLIAQVDEAQIEALKKRLSEVEKEEAEHKRESAQAVRKARQVESQYDRIQREAKAFREEQSIEEKGVCCGRKNDD